MLLLETLCHVHLLQFLQRYERFPNRMGPPPVSRPPSADRRPRRPPFADDGPAVRMGFVVGPRTIVPAGLGAGDGSRTSEAELGRAGDASGAVGLRANGGSRAGRGICVWHRFGVRRRPHAEKGARQKLRRCRKSMISRKIEISEDSGAESFCQARATLRTIGLLEWLAAKSSAGVGNNNLEEHCNF